MLYSGARRNSGVKVGRILDYVTIEYTHKRAAQLRGRVRNETVSGSLLFARIRQYYPPPVRLLNMWRIQRRPSYRLAIDAVAYCDLRTYLCKVPEHTGRLEWCNLVQVAHAFA